MGVDEERPGKGFREVQEVVGRSAALSQQRLDSKPDCNLLWLEFRAGLPNRSRQTCGDLDRGYDN